jgi:TRAP-type uncharacterized transport system substrate-binding protein
MPADLVYKMTKAFWEHVDEAHAMAPWMKTAVVRQKALDALAGDLHPGAEKYYREIGMKIPEGFNLDKVK